MFPFPSDREPVNNNNNKILVTSGKKMNKKKLRPFIYEDEVNTLLEAASKTKYPTRDKSIILLTYGHAYRASELCALQWEHIDFHRNKIRVIRQKGGKNFTHELSHAEKDLLLELKETYTIQSPHVFLTENGRPFERHGLKMLMRRLLKKCDVETHVHMHMLRHAKGVFLREKGVRMEDIRDYLGHKHLSSTEIYTQMASNPFFKNINDGSIFA